MHHDTASFDNSALQFRWWYLPSWLGLDAPFVVSTWTWAVAQNTIRELPERAVAAMFLVVWSIYLSDRLIDVARCRDWSEATGRLRFGRRLRPLLVACLIACLVGIAGLLWLGLPYGVIARASLVAIGVGVHFMVFVVPVFFRSKLPGKELGVGLFFALGAFACLGATIRQIPLFLGITVVVGFNCLVIAARDSESDCVNDPGGASRWWTTINRDLTWCGVGFTLLSTAAAFAMVETAFFVSLTAAFAALLLLHLRSSRLSGDAVRALADYALLTPVFIVPLAGRFS